MDEVEAEGRSVGSGHFALWLMPSGTAHARLAQLITALAREWSGHRFDPHVTLLGGITGETAKIVGQCEQLAASLRPFEIHLTEPGALDDYYRCLFLRVAHSPALIKTNAQARDIFHHHVDPAYLPHVSLLYGNHSVEVKRRIIALRVREIDLSFSVESLFLIDLAGEPQEWTIVRNFPFKKESNG